MNEQKRKLDRVEELLHKGEEMPDPSDLPALSRYFTDLLRKAEDEVTTEQKSPQPKAD